MIINLFIQFDPIIWNQPINLYINFIFIIIIINNYWKIKIINNQLLINFINWINLNKNFKSLYLLFFSLILLLITLNIFNLLPNYISLTNQLNFNINLTLIYWFIIIISIITNYNIFFINLTPKSTPLLIIYFINLIELNSLLFQILSLSIRLCINIIIGHIIIYLRNLILFIYLYLIIEFFIILIQSYIFITLNLLNWTNIN